MHDFLIALRIQIILFEINNFKLNNLTVKKFNHVLYIKSIK